MKFHFILILAILSFSSYGQDMKEYTGNWQGELPNKNVFNLTVSIQKKTNENSQFVISNEHEIINKQFTFENKIQLSLNDNLTFTGIVNNEQSEINGFIKSGMLFYHIKLKKEGNEFIGKWNILMIDNLKSQSLYLSVENGSKDDYQAYPIWGDDRFTGTWCDNFQKQNKLISFTDFKTGLQFKGKLSEGEIQLGIYLGTNMFTQVVLKKSTTDWIIGGFKSKNKASILQLTEMEKFILNDSLPNTHSVLISKKGKIVYENYFDGYNENIPHDMRSASKSISSAVVGIAKDKSLFNNVEQSIFDFLPKKYQSYKDSLKTEIDIQSLLTMSSGIDAIDYGINANPKSSATEQNYQRTPDWIEAILTAPMIHKPNTKANYGSANPALLGVAMDSIVSGSLELFIDKYLFQKLGISNYIIQTDLRDKPYFGGGMYLTPKDMLKFGELYLNKGKWNDKQVLSKKWIKKSFTNYLNLENTADKNGYGYLWWHHTYIINGKEVKSIEARGAGGQYIFIIPKLKVVAVITSGNYRNRKSQQPEKILNNYILPLLMEK
jgi:CubicO group peptidase (beta-lactamase class C family)